MQAKSAQVCSAIPALADVVRDARLRLQCAGMTYFKPASESGYLSNLFKRGCVICACCACEHCLLCQICFGFNWWNIVDFLVVRLSSLPSTTWFSSREVDVDCYLFDGYFVAIEKPDDQGEIVALLIPTTEDLGISVQHKNKALQLERCVQAIACHHRTAMI